MKKWLGQNNSVGTGDWIGFLDNGVKLEGTLELAGTFRIDGQIRGTVRAKDRLHLGENSLLEGEVEGSEISVAGRVTGTIRCKDRVEILASGVVEGDVHTPSLVIEPGGVLDGRCYMQKQPREPVSAPTAGEQARGFAVEESPAAD